MEVLVGIGLALFAQAQSSVGSFDAIVELDVRVRRSLAIRLKRFGEIDQSLLSTQWLLTISVSRLKEESLTKAYRPQSHAEAVEIGEAVKDRREEIGMLPLAILTIAVDCRVKN